MENSKYHRYCIGIVAENKLLSSNSILFTPHELTPMMQGEIVSNPQKLETTSGNRQGEEESAFAVIDGTLEAEWWPTGNRYTAPDVRRGELVEIYRFSDGQRLFWRELGHERHLRRLETTTYAWNAVPDDQTPVGKPSPDTHYIFEVSTHKKTITLTTSKANGEATRFRVQIDTGNGNLIAMDENGNMFYLDSKERRVGFSNADGTYFEANKKNLLGYAVENIAFRAEKTYSVDAQNIAQQASRAMYNKAGNSITNESTTIDHNAPKIGLNGAISQSPASGGGSSVSLIGPITCRGNGTFAGVPVKGHRHGGVENGGGQTDPA